MSLVVKSLRVSGAMLSRFARLHRDHSSGNYVSSAFVGDLAVVLRA